MKHVLVFIAVALMSILLVIFPQISSEAVQQSLKLCAASIIPSLFPFLILSNLWFELGYSRRIAVKMEPLIRKLFHLPGEAASALLLGCISGFPVGAKATSALYANGRLKKHEAEQLLLFCSNAGPAFIFGVIGNGIFQNSRIGAALWGIHIISAIGIGIFFRPKKQPALVKEVFVKQAPPSYSSAFVRAVSDAGNTMFQICVFIAAFSVIINFLAAALPSSFSHTFSFIALIGSLELSRGTALLSGLSKEAAFILSAVLLAWNGCCIHFQVLSLIARTDLRMHKYFLGKLLHMLLSLALACAAAPLLPLETACISLAEKTRFHIIGFIFISFVAMVIVKTSSGKECRLRI